MESHIGEHNGHAQSCATRSAGTRRIGSPESVEHSFALARGHANAIISHADDDHGAIDRKTYLHRSSFCEIDRISKQITYNTTDASRIDARQYLHIGKVDIQRHLFGFRDARDLFNRLADWFTNIAFSQIQCRVSGIETRNFQQISEHLLKSANLPVQQFHRAPGRGIIPILAHRQHVRRHAHGRHRRTQLMADVGDEFALHIAGFFEFIDFLHQ